MAMVRTDMVWYINSRPSTHNTQLTNSVPNWIFVFCLPAKWANFLILLSLIYCCCIYNSKLTNNNKSLIWWLNNFAKRLLIRKLYKQIFCNVKKTGRTSSVQLTGLTYNDNNEYRFRTLTATGCEPLYMSMQKYVSVNFAPGKLEWNWPGWGVSDDLRWSKPFVLLLQWLIPWSATQWVCSNMLKYHYGIHGNLIISPWHFNNKSLAGLDDGLNSRATISSQRIVKV